MADATPPFFTRKINMDRIITSYCHIRNHKVVVNDRIIFYQENILNFADFIKSVFKQEEIVYPKFYKMDSLSKLGFLAAELILKDNRIAGYRSDSVGVVLSNSSASLETDIAHNETIKDRSAYFPSPSVFVYTLPNIVIGEICIKHKIKGENAFLVSESFNSRLLLDYVNELFDSNRVDACLCGWVEVLGKNFDALLMLVEKNDPALKMSVSGIEPVLFSADNLNLLMNRN